MGEYTPTDYCTLLHTFVIDTILLTLYHYGMFHPSDNYTQRVEQIHFNMKINKLCTRCKVQFSEQLVLYYAAAT